MTSEFVKFPSTPHLLWLSENGIRSDKLLPQSDAKQFVDGDVVIEEKVDGTNVGISAATHGTIVVQSRGTIIRRGMKGEFAPLWYWLSRHEQSLKDCLGDQYVLFGEWCYARHSIRYTRLPDWFLAFDVYDKSARRFFSTKQRDQFVAQAGICHVPTVRTGCFSLEELPSFIGQSRLYDGPMEGIYLRKEGAFWLIDRAKIVRPEFVQGIHDHWRRAPLVANELVPAKCAE